MKNYRPFQFLKLNSNRTDLDFCVYVDHDHISPGTENQGRRPRLRVKVWLSKDGNAVGLTSIRDQGQNYEL